MTRRPPRSTRTDTIVPSATLCRCRQRGGEDAGRDEAWHRQRQQNLDQYLQARSAVDQRALLQLRGDRAEIAHQQPGAERDEEGRVGEDERDRKSTRLNSSH